MLIAHAAALFQVPSSTPTSLTAKITETLAEPGVLAFLVLIMALPIVFWVAEKVIGVFTLEDAADRELYDRADRAIAESERLTKKIKS